MIEKKVRVEEISDDDLIINGVKISGFIDEEECKNCHQLRLYSDKHDSYFCAYCDSWLEKRCSDPHCSFCKNRPKKPSILWCK